MGRFEAKTSLKGQATIPIEIRKALGLPPGGSVQFILDDGGNVSLVAKKCGLSHLKGIFGPSTAPIGIDEAILNIVTRRNARDRTEEDL